MLNHIYLSPFWLLFSLYSYQLALYSLARFCDKRISSYNRDYATTYNFTFFLTLL